MRAIGFAIVLILVVFTVFSLAAVETIHPINFQLYLDGVYGDCEWCGRAFSSVMHSNLTFFKHVIAGDSWGLLSIPLMETNPWLTAPVLLGGSCVVQMGLMNLMVAIIVDKAATARENDLELQHAMKQEALEVSFEHMRTLFR